jgi:hypothetical protein
MFLTMRQSLLALLLLVVTAMASANVNSTGDYLSSYYCYYLTSFNTTKIAP